MSRKRSSFSFDFIDIIEFFFRWKWHLLIITAVAAIAAAVFSGPAFITPKYKATVIFYPSPRNSIANSLLPDIGQRQRDPLEFGEEEDAEKALQILESSTLTGRLVRNFDLMNYYGIKSTDKFPLTKLSYRLKENISFKRTEFLSVQINVLDEDPEMAARIANGIANLYDTIKTEIQRQVAQQGLQIVEQQYKAKEKEIEGIRNALEDIGNKGVTNTEEQSKALAEAYYKAKSSGNSALVRELEEQRSTLAKYGAAFTELNETLILELEKLSDLRKTYEKARIDVEASLSHKFTVSDASKAEQKATPVRWIIVLVTMVTTFAFASLVLAIFEQYRRNKANPQA